MGTYLYSTGAQRQVIDVLAHLGITSTYTSIVGKGESSRSGGEDAPDVSPASKNTPQCPLSPRIREQSTPTPRTNPTHPSTSTSTSTSSGIVSTTAVIDNPSHHQNTVQRLELNDQEHESDGRVIIGGIGEGVCKTKNRWIDPCERADQPATEDGRELVDGSESGNSSSDSSESEGDSDSADGRKSDDGSVYESPGESESDEESDEEEWEDDVDELEGETHKNPFTDAHESAEDSDRELWEAVGGPIDVDREIVDAQVTDNIAGQTVTVQPAENEQNDETRESL